MVKSARNVSKQANNLALKCDFSISLNPLLHFSSSTL